MPRHSLRTVSDADRVPDPEDIKTILRIIELYEDDEVCDSPIIVVESGSMGPKWIRTLEYLWREDLIECRRHDGGGR